jgi:D-alanyl-D-alanine dipeptidase
LLVEFASVVDALTSRSLAHHPGTPDTKERQRSLIAPAPNSAP